MPIASLLALAVAIVARVMGYDQFADDFFMVALVTGILSVGVFIHALGGVVAQAILTHGVHLGRRNADPE